MPRVAGDDPGYTFALCRVDYIEDNSAEAILRGEDRVRVLTPTDDKIVFPSASTIIGEVLAKPPSAMAWWGYRVAQDAVLLADKEKLAEATDKDALELVLKGTGVTPNTSLEEAGDRGSFAHEVLEFLADGHRDWAQDCAEYEAQWMGAEYCRGVIEWWDTEVQPYVDSGEIVEVRSEVRVWSLDDKYAGTFDLALHWVRVDDEGNVWDDLGWEILDLKTHKPAAGFTKAGFGPAYISDVTQIRAYRKAFEECGHGKTFRQRVIVARDKAYRGTRVLEDYREVSYEFFRLLREAYDHRLQFEKGAA